MILYRVRRSGGNGAAGDAYLLPCQIAVKMFQLETGLLEAFRPEI